MAGVVTDSDLSERLLNGSVRGLSLGTNVMVRRDGSVGARVLEECSLCREPARAGCYVDHIANERVLAVHNASTEAGVLGGPCRAPAR